MPRNVDLWAACGLAFVVVAIALGLLLRPRAPDRLEIATTPVEPVVTSPMPEVPVPDRESHVGVESQVEPPAPPPPTSESLSRLVINVVDDGFGHPISGASAQLVALGLRDPVASTEAALPIGSALESDGDGRIVWESPPRMVALHVEIDHPDFAELIVGPVFAGEEHWARMTGAGALHASVVAQATGELLHGAEISLRKGVARRLVHSSAGEVLIDRLGPGTWDVRVRREGYAPARSVVAIAPYANTAEVFVLELGIPLSGIAIDADTEEPIADLDVSSKVTGDKAVTDQDGRFALRFRSDEYCDALEFRGAEHEDEINWCARTNDGAPVEFRVRRSGSAEVRIVRPDGQPLANGLVELFGPGLGCSPSSIRTDEAGWIELRGEFRSSWSTLYVFGRSADGFVGSAYEKVRVSSDPVPAMGLSRFPREVRETIAEAAAQPPIPDDTIKLLPAAELRGVVLSTDGSLVAGARVAIVGLDFCDFSFGRTKTSKDGTFRLVGLPSGWETRISVSHDELEPLIETVVIDPESELEITLTPRRGLLLRFIDELSAAPIKSLEFRITPFGGLGRGVLRSADAAGEAYVSALEPGSYSIEIDTEVYEASLPHVQPVSDSVYVQEFHLTRKAGSGVSVFLQGGGDAPLDGVVAVLGSVPRTVDLDRIRSGSDLRAHGYSKSRSNGELFFKTSTVDRAASSRPAGERLVLVVNPENVPGHTDSVSTFATVICEPDTPPSFPERLSVP